MRFSASYGTSSKISTALVILLLSGVAAVDFTMDGNWHWPIFLLIFLLVLLGFCYAFSVKYYEVTNESLIIKKPFGETVFKRSDIQSAATLDRKLLRYAIRTFGIGGVFGYYGEFYAGKVGNMTWYRTRLDNPVLIKIGNRKVVLSPDEPEKLIAALQS